MCELAANLWGRTGFAFILALCFPSIMQIWFCWLFRHIFEYLSGCCWLDTCWARCSVACALPGSLRFGSAATEGGAVSDLFASLLRWRSAHGIWAVATWVHPPAGRKEERERVFPALSLTACILLIKCNRNFWEWAGEHHTWYSSVPQYIANWCCYVSGITSNHYTCSTSASFSVDAC